MRRDGLVNNAADPRQVKKGRRAEKVRRIKEDEDLAWLLGDRRGRRIYWRIMSNCRVFNQSRDERGNDYTNFNEGKRSIGLKLLADLTRVKPEAYTLIIKEAKEDELKYKSGNKKEPEANE
jgi:hypothetical protein